MKNKNHHTFRTVKNYHTFRTVKNYHTFRTVKNYHTFRTVKNHHIFRTVKNHHTFRTVKNHHIFRTVKNYHTFRTVKNYHTFRTKSEFKGKNHVDRGEIDTTKIYKTIYEEFCLFIYLSVLTFPLEDCSEFGNFVFTLIEDTKGKIIFVHFPWLNVIS